MVKKLQILVYVILLSGLIIGMVQGFDSYKEDALNCASYFNADYSFYNEHLYWKENNMCCKYSLINNSIMELCDGR